MTERKPKIKIPHLVIFLATTCFFLYQHHVNTEWDFSVYVLNAKYLAGSGDYFEILRPPMVPSILVIFSPVGWKVSEYLFIVFTSLLFLYSNLRLARTVGLDDRLFYLCSFTPLVVFYGTLYGPNLLAMALLELFLVYVLERNEAAGTVLALACLTRYNFIIFLPTIFLIKDWKKILWSLLLFGLVFSPWLAFNHVRYGNFFTSIADSYALNVKFRGYVDQPTGIIHILAAFCFLFPVFFFGVYLTLSNKRGDKKTYDAFFAILFLLSLYQFDAIPFKHISYMMPITLPIAYFSAIGLEWLMENTDRIFHLMVAAIVLSGLLELMIIDIFHPYDDGSKYINAISALEQLGIRDCDLRSNAWPLLSYFGKTSGPFPRQEMLSNALDNGDFVLLFFSVAEPDYTANETFISQHSILLETRDFVLLGDVGTCNPERIVDKSYLSHTRDIFLETTGVEININPCFIFFENFPTLEKMCNFGNLHGFVLDENRNSPS
jgi:hypothetical protein